MERRSGLAGTGESEAARWRWSCEGEIGGVLGGEGSVPASVESLGWRVRSLARRRDEEEERRSVRPVQGADEEGCRLAFAGLGISVEAAGGTNQKRDWPHRKPALSGSAARHNQKIGGGQNPFSDGKRGFKDEEEEA